MGIPLRLHLALVICFQSLGLATRQSTALCQNVTVAPLLPGSLGEESQAGPRRALTLHRGGTQHTGSAQNRGEGATEPGGENCQKLKADCEFFFAGGSKGVAFPLSARNNFVSPPIRHVKGPATYAQIYINPKDDAPCRTTGPDRKPPLCSFFNVIGGSKLPIPKPPPQLNLARRDPASIAALKGYCYAVYFGVFGVIVGDGPGGRKFIKWSDPTKYFPRKKRCIVFQVT